MWENWFDCSQRNRALSDNSNIIMHIILDTMKALATTYWYPTVLFFLLCSSGAYLCGNVSVPFWQAASGTPQQQATSVHRLWVSDERSGPVRADRGGGAQRRGVSPGGRGEDEETKTEQRGTGVQTESRTNSLLSPAGDQWARSVWYSFQPHAKHWSTYMHNLSLGLLKSFSLSI